MRDLYVVGRILFWSFEIKRQIDRIYILKGNLQGSIKKIIAIAKERNILIQEVDKSKLDSMADGNVHQGVAALVTDFEYSTVEDILDRAHSLGRTLSNNFG